MRLGNTIKRIRKERGLTQGDVAKGVCTISALQKIECGKNNPGSSIFGIAENLGVTADYIATSAQLSQEYNYFKIKRDIIYYNKRNNFEVIETLINSIPDKVRLNLPSVEKQYLMYNEVCILTRVYKDFDQARKLAYDALYMTFNDASVIFTDTEMLLFNALLITDRTERNYRYLKKAIKYCEDNKTVVDGKVYLTLLNALLIINFGSMEWDAVLRIATRIEKEVTSTNESQLFLPNALFCQGVAQYKLGDKSDGIIRIGKAYSFAELLDQRNNIIMFSKHLAEHKIKKGD